MSGLSRALLVCVLLFHTALSWATTEVALERVSTGDNLVTDMLGLENADLGAQQLAQALRHPEWQPLNRHPELVAAPRQQSTLWLQARLSNGSGKPLQRWLELSPWRLSEVDAWLLDPHSGTVLEQIAVGRNIPVLERRIKSTRALVPVEMAAGETVLLVLRIHSASRPFLEITSWDPIDFKDDEVQRFQLHTVALTVILTLVAVLLLQLNMRYFLLSLWMLTLFFFESEKEGFISYLFAYSFQDYAKNLLYTSWVLASGFFLAVSVYLLGLNRHWLWRKVLPAVAAVTLIFSGLTFVLDGSDVRNLGSAIDLSLYALWLLMVPAALRQKREYQYWLLAVLALWWVTSVFILLGYIFNFYYTSVLAASKVVVKIGVIFALLLLYAHQKRMYEQSLERQIRQRERQQRQHLEQAVIERTRELHEAMEAAHEANAAKTQFLSRVTHDLKSPLTSILGYAQLLRVEQGKVGQMSHVIHTSATHMLNLVNRLVGYAQGPSSGALQLTSLYLPAFIESIGHEAEILAARNGNRFVLEIEQPLSSVIRCDETVLREIMLNLLDNAAKYTQEGDIRLRLSGQPVPGDKQLWLRFVVDDTGCGMTPEQQAKLFEPFYRVSTDVEGAGLGLPIVKQLVEKTGGTIHMSSSPGQGCRVQVDLPVEEGQEQAEFALLQVPADMLPQFDAEGRSAWVVEDADAIRELLVLELETLGFEVKAFADAESAISLLDAGRSPDLILTDYLLPVASGDILLQVVARLQLRVPVILLSATWSLQAAITHVPDEGFAACLGKPVDLIRLRREVAKACGLEQLTDGPTQPEQATVVTPPSAGDAMPSEQLAYWVQIGAVSDLVDWCDDMTAQWPAQAEALSMIRRLALKGDFEAVTRALAQMHPCE